MEGEIARAKREIVESGLVWVIAGFGALIIVNLITLALGPDEILQTLNSHAWGVLVSVFVFDSWGTAAGLAGVVILFTPVLFGVPKASRLGLSVFFLIASIGCGIIAIVLWSHFYDSGGPIGAGSSAIDISGQGIILALSVFGLISLWLTKEGKGVAVGEVIPREWRQFFFVAYATLIVSSLYFVIVLEPIYIPTQLYNWRVHEDGFFMAIAATAAYVAATSKRLILRRSS